MAFSRSSSSSPSVAASSIQAPRRSMFSFGTRRTAAAPSAASSVSSSSASTAVNSPNMSANRRSATRSASTSTTPTSSNGKLPFLLFGSSAITQYASLAHQTTSANSSSRRVAKTAQSRMLPHLPNELIILIFETMDTKKLLHVRLTTRKFKALADVVLADRFSKPTWLLSQTTKTLKSAFTELNDTQRPYMDHYSQFLVNLPSTDVTEATWYTAPPQELQTVCECLCILRGAVPVPANATPASLAGPQRIAMSWPAIKRIMGRYDFKTWFVGLDKTAKTIDAANVRRVEDIIRMDPLITYERLRDVSQAGYKLLIVVAACLQFGNIYNQIETRRAELVSFERKFDRSTRFLAAVGGSQTAFMLKPAPLAASASSATLSDASDSSDNADTRSLSSSASSETLTDLSDD